MCGFILAGRLGNLDKIAEWLGDSVAVARKHYARYSPDYLNEGADALSDWD